MLKVLSPITLATAMLASSNVPETDHPEWVSGTTYAADARVIRASTHRRYQRVSAGAGTTAPELDTVNWVDMGPTNRWAMFDTKVSTPTTGLVGGLDVTLSPGRCNGLALLDMSGITAATVVCQYAITALGVGGVVTSRTEPYAFGITKTTETSTVGTDGTQTGYVRITFAITLENRSVSNWAQYFVEPYAISTDVFVSFASRSDMTVRFTTTNANPKIGALMVGNFIELGDVGYSVKSGIDDYSTVTTDAFGTSTLIERDYVKRVTYPVTVPNYAMRRTFSTLAGLRAKAAVFIGSDDYRYTPFTVFGRVASFDVALSFATYSVVNVEIQGVAI